MKELIFLLIYITLGAGLLAAYYFNLVSVFVMLTFIYFAVLVLDCVDD